MVEPRRRKALGQHHLRDGSLCAPLLEFLEPREALVLEIGPGGGVLTAQLLGVGARVIAVELDVAWAAHLRRRALGASLCVGDALRLDWSRLPPGTRVTGNLPYAISTALIEQLLAHGERLGRCAFLVQREVADRLLARPGDPAYGSLSVLVAAAARGRRLGRVRPGSFVPPPKVESSFVGLELEPLPVPAAEWSDFKRFVRLAFARRRKTLFNSLKAAFGTELVRALLEEVAVEPSRRAETLDLDLYLDLFRALGRSGHRVPGSDPLVKSPKRSDI